ncbi:TPA: T7SS effector LXG polymorphic toxin [Enterococcus faecium]|uniref:T7SS effector LXG polymorphic toxin n=1 Tax=Enterococcus TaxID=1350 RepID=UPI001E38234C|nr:MULTISPECIES: T7SS effector LXG polymorphic toxin [Enterococcus]MCD9223273.1 LXG domain-containing protein [Enterococcus lactis]
MGLIYSSKDASTLKSSLSANLSIARTTIRQLNAGSQQLIAAIDGHTLSGAAYNAGKGLFSDLILPTIKRVSSAIVTIQQELNQFSAANSFIASEGYLDEENLNQQLTILQRSKASLENAAHTAGALANIPLPTIAEMLRNQQQDFLRRAESYQRDIVRIQKKLNQLKEFDAKTKHLFTSSLEEFELAMQAVLVLNNTTVNRDGSYVLPKGTDASWFTKMNWFSNNQGTSYRMDEINKDIGDVITDLSGWVNESSAAGLDSIKEKVIEEGKNLGKSLAAKLQPRTSLGTFMKDNNKARRWVTSKLKGMSNSTSTTIGSMAKWGGQAMIVLGAYSEFKDFYDKTNNIGRSLTYSTIATTTGIAAGTIGSALGGVVAGAFTGTSVAGLATVGLPIAGAIAVGAVATVGIKALYNHVKPFNDFVNSIGDTFNKIGERIERIGTSFASPLNSHKGVLG